MIMMAKLQPSAYENRTLGYNTSQMAHDLGSVCLRVVRQPAPPGRSVPAYPIDLSDVRDDRRVCNESEIGQWHFCQKPLTVVRVSHAVLEPYESVFYRTCADRSGIIGFHRIRGLDYGEQRFLDRYYVMSHRDRILGVAQISVDLQDRRARILRLEVQFDGLQAVFLRQVLDNLRGESILQTLASIVVDVQADCARLHRSLQTLGFVPTVYYPALVSIESGRIDALQFTRIIGDERPDFPAPPVELGGVATNIIRAVLASYHQMFRP
jgi:hypothetical protein